MSQKAYKISDTCHFFQSSCQSGVVRAILSHMKALGKTGVLLAVPAALMIIGLVIYLSKRGHNRSTFESQRLVELLRSLNPTSQGKSESFDSLHLAVRSQGLLLKRIRVGPGHWESQVHEAMGSVDIEGFDSVTLCFGHNSQRAETPLKSRRSYQTDMGVKGFRFQYQGQAIDYCGLTSISTNRTPWKMLTVLSKSTGVSPESMNTRELQLTVYDNLQYHVNWRDGVVKEMYRGNQLVPLDDINKKNLHSMVDRLAGWLVNNTNPTTGKMQYKYWPSSGRFSDANNMIRQFMATYALQRWGDRQGDNSLKSLALDNLAYNLQQFYKEAEGVGFIEFQQKRKLGAAGLAALSIYKSSQPERFRRQYRGLMKAIEGQWQRNGSFRTFILQERNDLHNFYPGEALFYWAHVIENQPQSHLLKKFMKSAGYYMKWHMKNRNPAFVPWHTQAYYRVWKINKSKFLKNSIFKMNDWLVESMQGLEENEGYSHPDFQGRFYYPKGGFGPPHASATGVYLEGLIDAWELAKDTGDKVRQEQYRRALLKGLRHAMQLEFRDDLDMYYISNRKAALGGLRTKVYDNEIRMDNIQHNLLAFFKILDRFDESDYSF